MGDLEPTPMSDLETEPPERLVENGWDRTLATTVAERAATFADDHEEADLTAETFLDRLAAAPYDDSDRQWNWVVGDVAAEIDDCTDSRDYRLESFGDVGSTG